MTSAQMYKGLDFDTTWDGSPLSAGVIYNYNDLSVTAYLREGDDKKEEFCRSNFPDYRNKKKPLKWYYLALRVSNYGKYPIRFGGVPSFSSINLRENLEDSARKVCTNPYASPSSIRFNVRSIEPGGAIELDDSSNGGLFFETPKIIRFRMSHYQIVNPNVNSRNWTNLDYREYEKKYGKNKGRNKGKNTGKTDDDLLDDIANDLENDLNNTKTKNKKVNEDWIKDQIKNSSGRVTNTNKTNSKNNSNSSKTNSKKNGTSSNTNYSAASCQTIKNKANRVYRSITNFIKKGANMNGNIKYSFSPIQLLQNQMDRFSKEYTNAIKTKQLSPKCQRQIGNIMGRYTDELTNYLKRFTGGVLKKY